MVKAYTLSKAGEASGTPYARLRKQIELGFPIISHKRGDVASPGQGKPAFVTFHTVMQFGLANRLTTQGVPAREAMDEALSFAHSGTDTRRKPGRPFPTGHTIFVYPKALGEVGPIVHCADDVALKKLLYEHFSHFDPLPPMVNLNLMYETIAENLGSDPEDYRNRERSSDA